MTDSFEYQVTMQFEPDAPPWQYGTLYLAVYERGIRIGQWSIPVEEGLDRTIKEVDRDLREVIQQGVNRCVSYHRAVQSHTAASNTKPQKGSAR